MFENAKGHQDAATCPSPGGAAYISSPNRMATSYPLTRRRGGKRLFSVWTCCRPVGTVPQATILWILDQVEDDWFDEARAYAKSGDFC